MIASEYRRRASAIRPTTTSTTTRETTEIAFSAVFSGPPTLSRPRFRPARAMVSSICPRMVCTEACETSRNSTMLTVVSAASQAAVVAFGPTIALLCIALP